MAKEKKPLVAKSNLTDKEKALEAMKITTQSGATETAESKEIHRYNIEIPHDVFLEMKEFVKSTGYNLKGFFLAAAKEKMKREKTA
jgi:hypothetical protein